MTILRGGTNLIPIYHEKKFSIKDVIVIIKNVAVKYDSKFKAIAKSYIIV